jgi:hypothetical protein
MIGGSIFGIQIGHSFIAGIIGFVVNLGLFLYMAGEEGKEAAEKKKALEIRAAAGDKTAQEELQKLLEARAATGDKAAKEELQKQAAEKRRVLETRATEGDEAAKQELIEMGTDIEGFFCYYNFDYDANALQRLYNIIDAAITEKGRGSVPIFIMEEVKQTQIGGVTLYKCEGKTTQGDTIYMEYQIGRTTPGKLIYSLHLKLLPEIVLTIQKEIEEQLKVFKSTLTEWRPEMDQVPNNYRSDDNYSSTDNVPKEKTKVIYVYANSMGYGDIAFTIKGDHIYKGGMDYGDIAFTIKIIEK